MIDRNKYASLAEALADVDDLEEVKAALVREEVIRTVSAESGEDRQHVADLVDAMASMGQEEVLALTNGEPTTLRDGLQRYVESMDYDGAFVDPNVLASDLETLLAYPWPGAPELVCDYPENDEHLVITLGGQEVASASHDEHGWAGMEAVQTTAEAVYKALTSRN